MNIDKKIEKIEKIGEMAILMAKNVISDCALPKTCAKCEVIETCLIYEMAERLYNAGYRKHTDRFLLKENGEIIPLLPKQSEWISVEDRLPEESGDYITYHEHGNCGVIYYNSSIKLWNVYYFEDTHNAIRSVTHWMPLPEAPKMKGGEE